MKKTLKERYPVLFRRYELPGWLGWPGRLNQKFLSLFTLRRIVVGVAVLVTLVALFYTVENVRGKLAWNKYVREVETKGETLDIMELIPGPVPDEENFAMIPLFDFLEFKAADLVKLPDWSPYFDGISGLKRPKLGNWIEGERTDLEAWQNYYRDPDNLAKVEYPVAENPQSPAQDILLALSILDSEFQALKEGSVREYSQFPIRYEDNFNALLPHLTLLKPIVQSLILRSVANLAVDNSDDSFEDVMLALYVRDSVKTEPLLISHLVRAAINTIALQPVWEGIARGEWNEQQLAELQKIFESDNWIEDLEYGFRGERAIRNATIDALKEEPQALVGISNDDSMMMVILFRWAPSGWLEQNKLTMEKLWDRNYVGAFDSNKKIVDVSKLDRMDDEIGALKVRWYYPYNLLAGIFMPALSNAAYRFAQNQTSSDQAALACAIERYRLKTDSLPETLDLLVPAFIEELPHDVITGEPLIYNLISESEYVLYSVGVNQIDDGGVLPDTDRFGNPDGQIGDWVWHYSKHE